MRFIFVSFAFMAWAFYEMSGGAAFDPEAVKTAKMQAYEAERAADAAEAEATVTRAATTTPVVVAEAPKVVVDTDPPALNDFTPVALNLTSADEVLEETKEAVLTAAPEADPDTDAVPQNVSLVSASADTPAIIPSLIQPSTTVDESTLTSLNTVDIRRVSGNRVNVRGGPGTSFGVVASLVRGAEVMVLEDNGAGWVRFETIDGRTNGWMADFLLTGG